MKKRNRAAALLLAGIMALSASMPAFAANEGINGGIFIDTTNMTWEANDGTVTVYGGGSVFSDVHPEITDPEYYLHEYVKRPDEPVEQAYNSKGEPKANFAPEIYQKMKEFVNSFDWIHADERTRFETVHNRVSNGFSGNYYGSSITYPSFSVLMEGHGTCGDFSGEFVWLSKLVGLADNVVQYTPSQMHAACMMKIGNQWFAIDPTSNLPFLSNAKTYPVDYETELHRFDKEEEARYQQEYAEGISNPVAFLRKINLQLANGEITDAQFDAEYAKLEAYLAQQK